MSCQSRFDEWTTCIRTHLPTLTKPQAAVLALWSLGLVLARSCALTAVSVFWATVPAQGEHGAAAVAGVVLRGPGQAGQPSAQAPPWTTASCRCCAGCSPGGRARNWPWPSTRRPWARPSWCWPSAWSTAAAPSRWGGSSCPPNSPRLEARVAAPAAAAAAGHSAGDDGHRAGRPGAVRPLAVRAHRAAGLAPLPARERRRHVPPRRVARHFPAPGALRPRAGAPLAGHRHGLPGAGAAGCAARCWPGARRAAPTSGSS